ncbi:hypothetical protein ALDI51_21820 [Alicycliphilus denitrificans]|jgi:hypothetical protein|uniref:Uncharacterized protein n=1 Tax=Alicycliphilus denitrificans TaxID=179636 RepID=A0A420KI63_9BURK|nr:hypothetical protein [Alicycliphilus denitrificans]OJW90357.1 MAG: hypothetical protein BGO66_04995 [Alicycliphilus sp. 69-12]MBN9573650.1 hypothetical protein [Alicycliphilus denitrificans]RKJ99642.1 hypothetical protein CE154_007965 [Alicycliphilus denitrificans]BCN38863.1 hypothetical protein ALDI51_21820 [Alicycliphilus denitrificans]HRO79915.1 hypothetical protein [Alicycliphilus denitrificans]
MPRAPYQPTPEQQEVLDRILAQRERLRARRDAMRQARAAAAPQGRVNPGDPLIARLVSFARLHPLAVAAVLGVAALAGPGRVVRWAGVVLPAILRMRRG